MTQDEKLLLSLGGRASLKGFDYIIKRVELLREDPSLVNGITKTLLPQVAEMCGTTWQRVERCIRHTITGIYNNNAEVPAEFAPSSAKGTLNNKEFLARFVRIAEETA